MQHHVAYLCISPGQDSRRSETISYRYSANGTHVFFRGAVDTVALLRSKSSSCGKGEFWERYLTAISFRGSVKVLNNLMLRINVL